MLRIRKISHSIILLLVLTGHSGVEGSGLSVRTEVFRLKAGTYRIDNGRVRIPEFGTMSLTGAPDLPSRTFQLNLGSGAEILDVEIIPGPASAVNGVHDIRPAASMLSLSGEAGSETDAVECAVPRSPEIYESDDYWPPSSAIHEGASQTGKAAEIRIRFMPFRYNPVRRSLIFTEEVAVRVRFTAPPGSAGIRKTSGFDPMPEAAAEEGMSSSLLIVTSSVLKDVLDPYVFWKRCLGDSVRIAETENIFGHYPGAERIDQLRSFLQEQAAGSGITDVLLIGHRDMIPMKKLYPNPLNHSESGAVPSDLYLSNLTCDWDADGDGFYGEFPDDRADGLPEIRVGRIPWSDPASVGAILRRIVDYERTDEPWKNIPLLAAGILNYRAEGGSPAYPEKTDGAALMEYLRKEVFLSAPSAVLYEKDGEDISDAECTLPLSRDNLVSAWSAGGFGCASWWAHGNSEAVSRKRWLSDDGNGIPESAELVRENLFTVQSLPVSGGFSPVVYANACDNGWPEKTSLGRELMRTGCTAVLASSRTSWYAPGWTDPSDGGNASLTAFFWNAFMRSGMDLGGAVESARREYLDRFGVTWQHWQNALTLVLYGDPTLSLRTGVPVWGALCGALISEEDGRPVTGSWSVRLEGTNHSSRTDASGRFTFDRLPGGRYILAATSPDGVEFRSEVEVSNGVRSDADVPVRTRLPSRPGIQVTDSLIACRLQKGLSALGWLRITNPGDGPLELRAVPGDAARWIRPDTAALTISPGSLDSLKVRFSADSLPSGEFRSLVNLYTNVGTDSIVRIPAVLAVFDTTRSGTETDSSRTVTDPEAPPDPSPLSPVDGKNVLPRQTRLLANHPNPFNGWTRIGYTLAERTDVRITILDAFGRTVRELIREWKEAGAYTAVWNACDTDGRTAVSGLYLVRMTAEGKTETSKILLVR